MYPSFTFLLSIAADTCVFCDWEICCYWQSRRYITDRWKKPLKQQKRRRLWPWVKNWFLHHSLIQSRNDFRHATCNNGAKQRTDWTRLLLLLFLPFLDGRGNVQGEITSYYLWQLSILTSTDLWLRPVSRFHGGNWTQLKSYFACGNSLKFLLVHSPRQSLLKRASGHSVDIQQQREGEKAI
jgi:hypothetical protein